MEVVDSTYYIFILSFLKWYPVSLVCLLKGNTVTFFYNNRTNLRTKCFVMCKVYTDVGGITILYHVCPPVHKIIHSLKLVDYLHVQADNPWYNYYISWILDLTLCMLGNFSWFFCFWIVKIFFFLKIQECHQCKTVWIQIRPDILSGLIPVQTVCKGYQ